MTGQMRILALVTDGFGSFGGIAQYNSDLLSGLARSFRVDHVRVIARHGSVANIPAKIRQLPAPSSKAAYALCAARAALLDGPWHWLFCGHIHLAPLSAALARLSNARLWIQVHGIEAWQPARQASRSGVERAHLVTSVSRFTRHRLLSWADIAPERVRVLPNTVAENFAPDSGDSGFVHRHGLAGKKVLLTVGRLAGSERYKGHDRVIEALPQISVVHPDTVYVIAGSGDDQPRLQELASRIGVSDRLVFAGQIDPAELADVYRSADLYVMPSTGEGFGIAFLEAMACGTRAVGSNMDASRDPLRDGELGTVVALDQLAATIIELLYRPSRDAELAFRTREMFGRARFNNALNRLLMSVQ